MLVVSFLQLFNLSVDDLFLVEIFVRFAQVGSLGPQAGSWDPHGGSGDTQVDSRLGPSS